MLLVDWYYAKSNRDTFVTGENFKGAKLNQP